MFIYLFIYFFIYDSHRERERGRDTGRGRSRLHTGSQMQDLISRIMPWAKGGTKQLSHLGCPKYLYTVPTLGTENVKIIRNFLI